MGTSRGGHTIAGFPASHLGNLLEHIKFIGGHGSGINADTVDGIEGASIITLADVTTVGNSTSSSGKLLRLDSNGFVPASITGNAATATKLATARSIALSGDVTGSANFDGTGNITITATQKNSGVTAGTYRSVTVDAKGNVTSGTNPTTLSGYGITDAYAKSGGTLSGNVEINKNFPVFTMYDTYSDNNTAIMQFKSPANQGVQLRYTANDGQLLDAQGYALIVEKTDDNTQTFKASFQVEGNIYSNGSKVLTVADEGSGKGIDADTVDGVHLSGLVQTGEVVTAATANKILKLNGSGILPASITGNSDTVDGKHVDDAQTGTGYLWTANKTYTELQKIVQTSSASIPATAGWYRVAQSVAGINRCSARFEIDWAASGNTGQVIFNAAIMYGKGASLNQTLYSTENPTVGLTKARIVYNTSSNGNYAYVEIYNSTAASINVNLQALANMGWTLITPNTVGSIPSGYTSIELPFVDGISTEGILRSAAATGTAPLMVASTTVVTNLNADMLDGLHESTFARKAITLTGGTGIVTSIGDLSANRTINFDTTWGDGRYATLSGGNSFNGTQNFNGNSLNGIGWLNGQNGLIARSTDSWLRINEDSSHSSGTYFGSGIIRTDGTFQVGNGGATAIISSSTFTYKGGSIWHAGNFDPNSKANASITLTGGNGIVTSIGNLSANRTISVDFAGTGSANTVSRSDHSHPYQKYPLTSDNGIAQQAATDWNNYADTGFYRAQSLANQGPGTHTWKYVINVGHDNTLYALQLSADYNASGFGMRVKNNGTWGTWKEFWHDGNHGPGSGMNADLLDGLHESSFARKAITLTGGNGIVTSIGDLSANRTITVDFAGNGSANTVARSDHFHYSTNPYGGKSAPTGRTAMDTGVFTYTTYNDGNTPSDTPYGEIVSFGRGASGHAEMLVSWNGNPKVYVRSLRDTTDNWTAWRKVWTEDTFNPASKLDASANAVSASKLATARTITLAGEVTGSATFDGSANISITATVQDDSHNHVISNIDNLQTTLDGKASTSITLTGGTGIVTSIGNLTANRTINFDTSWGDGRYATVSGGNNLTGVQKITNATGSMLSLVQSDTSTGLYNYVGFYDSSNTMRAYIGYNSSKDGHFYFTSQSGDVVLNAATNIVQMNAKTLTIDPKSNNSVGIELGTSAAYSTTPFIDFHSSIYNVDYDARIVASGGSSSNGAGSLNVAAYNFTHNGNKVLTDASLVWNTLTLQNGVQVYNSGDDIQYAVIGNIVYIRGFVKNITTNDVVVATLPASVRPARAHSFVQNTTIKSGGGRTARWIIEADGTINMQRTSDNTSAAADWFPVHTSYPLG